MDQSMYSHLIFNKGINAVQWRSLYLFSKWCENNRTDLCKGKKSLYPYVTPCTQITFIHIIVLSIKTKIIQLQQEKTGDYLCNLGNKDFMNRTKATNCKRKKLTDWTSKKFFKYAHQKILLWKWKGKPYTERRIFANHIFDERLVYWTYNLWI